MPLDWTFAQGPLPVGVQSPASLQTLQAQAPALLAAHGGVSGAATSPDAAIGDLMARLVEIINRQETARPSSPDYLGPAKPTVTPQQLAALQALVAIQANQQGSNLRNQLMSQAGSPSATDTQRAMALSALTGTRIPLPKAAGNDKKSTEKLKRVESWMRLEAQNLRAAQSNPYAPEGINKQAEDFQRLAATFYLRGIDAAIPLLVAYQRKYYGQANAPSAAAPVPSHQVNAPLGSVAGGTAQSLADRMF